MRSTWHAAWLALILSFGPGGEALAYTPGKDGTLNVAADTVVNTYSPLVVAAGAGDTTITVENAATLGITPGDVLMVYQAQGATIDGANTAAFGNVSGLGNAGRFEFVNVVSVAGNVIRISDACSPGLRFAYSGAATAVPPAVQAFRAQVIRVPQYVDLNINAGGRLLPQAWNGSTGGVVAVFVQGTAAINGNGIVASGRGFRGGLLDNVTTATGTDVTLYRGTLSDNGGEKGESIAGYQAQYDVAAIGGRYGRGAPANGGGGGNAHNAGGGGGANHGAIASWNNGQGNPDTTTASWNAAWLLDPTLGCTNTPSFSCPVRSGGGRGGYTYGSTNQNALTLAPGGAAWGGNLRRERGGLGGRPLINDPALATSRLYLGGGGGAGDGNNGAASSGAAGGGLVFLVANAVTGAGPIAATGATATNTIPGHNDAPGGGGGGGSIVVVAGTYAGPALNAAGGNAGNQLITGAESEGPGGGGGGGYIAVLPAGSVPAVAAVAAGANGITNSSSLVEFVPNGSTRGAAGATATAPAVSGMAICPVSQADLSITKGDGGASVVPGTNVTYTLAVTNLGPAAATSLTVSDTIPAGLGFVSATGTGWACSESAGVVTCTRANLAVGAAPAIALVLSVPANYGGANPIPNTATVVATTSDPAAGNNSGSDTTPLAPAQADLAITKSDGGASAVLGGSISYTLSVQNLGPSNAANLSVTDAIPAGLAFNSASGAGWACGEAAGVVTCTRAALASGATAPAITLVLNVPVGYAGANPIPNSATIASATIDPAAGNNTGSDTTPLLAPPNLALAKSDGGASVVPGGTVAYTLSYSNSSTSAATGVVITETVPANTTFNAGASTAGWACVPDNNAGSTCTLAIGSVAGGASGSATYAVTVNASVPAGVTSIANSATIGDDGTGGPDPNPGDNTGSDTTPVNAAPDLTVVKSDGGASVAPGGTVAYTLFYDNNGNQGATGVVLTETVPANTTFNAGASSAGWTCVPNNNAGSTCSLAVGALAALTGAARTFAVTVANPLAVGVTLVANTVSIADDGSNGPDPSPGNNSGSDTTPIDAAPDLAVTKSDGGASVVPGTSVTYTLNYANNGNQDAVGVLLTETVPANTTFNAGASTAGWACVPDANAGSTCTLAIGALAAGGSGSATYTVDVPANLPGAVTQIANSVVVADDGSNGPDPNPGDNTGSDTTPVAPASADVSIVKDDAGASVVPGNNLSYTLAVANAGPSDAAGLSVTDTIPAGLGFVSATGAGWACGEAAGLVTCTRATLALGAAPVITLVVSVPANYAGANPIVNSATVATTSSDPTPGNNTDGETTPVSAPLADLSMAKDDGGASVTPGGNVSYTLAVANAGPSDAAAVSVTDTVPAGLVFVSATGTGWACGEAAGLVTCTRATLAVGAAPAITLVLNVPANYAGANPIVNSATVATTTTDPTPGNDTDSDTTPVNAPSADLSIVKDDAGASVTPGNNLTYTLAVANAGLSDATAVSVTDTIPAGLGFVSAGGAGWVCGEAAGLVTCTRATLAVGAAPLITLVVSVPANYAGANPIVNSVTVTSTTTDPTPGDNTDGESTPVAAPSADLSLLKDDAGASVTPGNNLSYTLSVSNAGPSDAAAPSVTDTIPAGLGFVSASGAGWACGEAAGLVTCTRATLTVGAAPVITLVVSVPANYAGANPILNSGSVASTTADPTPGNNTDGESTPVDAPSANLAIVKDDGGASVAPGNNVTYTLSVNNAGPSDAAAPSVTDTIPAGLTFVSATGAGWACGEAAGVVTCTRATLAVGAAPAITLVLGVPSSYAGANPIVNSSSVTSTTNDPTPGDNTDSDTTPVNAPSADLNILKDDGGASVVPGNNLSYSLSVANVGPSDATALSVTDTIPAGLGFVSATGAGWACGEAAGVVTCTRPTLAVGAAPAITLVLGVPANYAGANPIVNSATVGSATTDPTPGDNTDSDTTPVSPPSADLNLGKDDGGATVVPGNNVTYTLSVANVGPSDAAALSVSDTIPAGLGFVSATGAGWACGQAAGVVTCTRPTLAVGAAPVITLVLSVPANYAGANPIVNAATVTSTTSDPTPGDNTDSDTTPVGASQSDLSILKDDAGASVTPGSNLTYTLSVANAGPSDAATLSVTDTIPAGLGFVSATGVGWACGEAAGVVTCTRPTLAVGAAPAITLVLSVPANYAGANPILNSATVGSASTDPNPGDNTDGESTPVNAASADLNLVKDDAGATVVPGNNLTYTLAVANAGPSDAAALSVTDTIPAGLGFVSATGAGWACGQAAGVVTCTRPTLAVGAAPAITLVVSVPANYAGANPILNSATVGSSTADPTPGDNTDGESTPVGAGSADLAIAKDDGGASVVPGNNVTYALDVTNLGPSDASTVSVTDAVPAGLGFVSATGAGWTCGEAAGVVTCTRATLAVGPAPSISVVFSVPASYTGANPIANSAAVAATTADPNPGNNTDGDTTPVGANTADLSIVKDDGGATVQPGNNVTYTLDVSNAGPSDATGLSVTDTVPAGLAFVSASGAGWTCGQAAGVVTCTRPTLAVGAAPQISVVFSVPAGYAGANPIVNSASVASTSTDPNPGNNTDGDTTPVGGGSADLSITKDDGGATAVRGTNLAYTLAVANAGPSDATSISVSDTVPAGLTFVSATGPGWTCGEAAGVVTCTRPTLVVGPAPDITLVLNVAANYNGADPILNSANVGAATSDPNPGNNTDGDTTPLGPSSADLAITKSDGGATVAPGANVTYTLAVSNLGPSDAAGVSVSDPIPAGLNYVSATGAGWTCGQAAGVVTCTLPTLAVGAAAPITLVLGVPASYAGADPIANTATVSATTADPNAGNNSGSDTTPLGTASADLAITKSDGGATVLPGGNVSYALAVTNNGPSSAAAVSVSDTLPAGLTFVSATGAGWTCGQAAGVVTCTLPTLAPGPAPLVTLVLGVPAAYAGANPIVNSATVSSTTPDPVPGNNTGSDTTPVGNASADLAITKTDGGVSVAPGANVVYTLVITNNGPSDAVAVSVADATPAGTTFVSNSGDCTTPFPCALGTLASGQSRTITTTITVGSGFPAPGTVTNTATVSSTTPDTVPGNNTATETTPVGTGTADLVVVKTGPGSVVQGTNATWWIVVRNQGPSDALSVVLTDATPPGLTYVSSTAPCATGFPCSLGTLAAGATVTVDVTFAIPSPYYGAIPLVNRATVTSITPDPNPDDNTDTVESGVGTGNRQIPVDANWALALLALLMLGFGARRARQLH